VKTIACIILIITPLLALGDDLGMSPSIQEVKKKHETQLLDIPGVVSVGIGMDANGKQAIVVGLESPDPEIEAKIPAELEGFPVVIQTIGSLKAR